MKQQIATLGAGAWGTALAVLFAKNGHPSSLWGRNQNQLHTINQHRENKKYLPGITLPQSLNLTNNIHDAVKRADIVLLAVSSQGFRQTLANVKPHIKASAKIAWATKGFEHGSYKFMHQLVAEELGQQREMAIISGPTFAKEVAQGLATAVTVASFTKDFALQLAELLHNENFRAYTSNDVIGVEIGGAVKNPLAIASGIADGLGLGANTRAALITRGLVEIQRLGSALGAHPETLMGLAGLGDLVLTCTDNQSRNRRVGLALAQGNQLSTILADLGQVAEGVYAAKEVYHLAHQHKVDMPITEQVYQVLYENLSPHQAVRNLLARSLKPEY